MNITILGKLSFDEVGDYLTKAANVVGHGLLGHVFKSEGFLIYHFTSLPLETVLPPMHK